MVLPKQGQERERTKAMFFVANPKFLFYLRHQGALLRGNIRRKRKEEKRFFWKVGFCKLLFQLFFYLLQTIMIMRQIPFADSTIRDDSVGSPESTSHEELSVEFEALIENPKQKAADHRTNLSWIDLQHHDLWNLYSPGHRQWRSSRSQKE